MITDSITVTHVTTAGLAVGFINWLKNNKSPLTAWINRESPKAARYLALVTAAIGTIGIHYTWNPDARTLSFAVPTLATALSAGILYVKSFVWQELTYQMTKRPNIAELVAAVVKAIQGSTMAAPGSANPQTAGQQPKT